MSMSERTNIFAKYEDAKNRIKVLEDAITNHKIAAVTKQQILDITKDLDPIDLILWKVLDDKNK